MSYAIYDYIQSFCFPHLKLNENSFEYRSSSMTSNQLEQCIRDIREFFAQRRLIYMNDSSSTDTYLFLSISQLLWQAPTRSSSLSIGLVPYFFLICSMIFSRSLPSICTLSFNKSKKKCL